MLTDQVEAQGAKISDLQSSLVEHQQKLRSTGEMLQQVNSSTCLQWPGLAHQRQEVRQEKDGKRPQTDRLDLLGESILPHKKLIQDYLSFLCRTSSEFVLE